MKSKVKSQKLKIYVYEDEYYKDLLPLVYLRPVFDLYCGVFTFRDRIQKLYPEAQIYQLSRFDTTTITLQHQAEYKALGEHTGSPLLFINGRAILHSPLPDEEGVFVAGDEVIGFKIKDSRLKIEDLKPPIEIKFLDTIKREFKSIEVKATVIKYLWDLIKENEATIIEDYKLKVKSERGSTSKLKVKGVYLLENEGPIYIGDNVQIKPPTVIEGPCYIGSGSLIDGAKIRKGTTIGKYCRIGGEVERSIFSDFSNKHHEGFVGHSYIGEWVNLGALTTTSDLKNTYSTVKIQGFKGSKVQEIDTGLVKLGSFIGDHTKTGIGTLLDTGSVIGCFVNLYGGGVAPRYIPSFSWGTKDKLVEYKLDKAIEVAKIVMARRGMGLTDEYKALIRKVFEATQIYRVK